jgi:hypothetical protein
MFLKNGCVAPERSKVGALPESLQMPFGGVPFDAADLLVGLVDAAGGFPALAVRRGVEQCAGAAVRVLELSASIGVDSVADLLDDHRRLLSVGLWPARRSADGDLVWWWWFVMCLWEPLEAAREVPVPLAEQFIEAGSSAARTTLASIRIAVARPTPASFTSSCDNVPKIEKTPTITSAALVTPPAVRVIP